MHLVYIHNVYAFLESTHVYIHCTFYTFYAEVHTSQRFKIHTHHIYIQCAFYTIYTQFISIYIHILYLYTEHILAIL